MAGFNAIGNDGIFDENESQFAMNFLSSSIALLADRGWLITGIVVTVGYVIVFGFMMRKVLHDRGLPEEQKPGPRSLFYLGQAYLAFVWPVPLFLVLEALDFLGSAPR